MHLYLCDRGCSTPKHSLTWYNKKRTRVCWKLPSSCLICHLRTCRCRTIAVQSSRRKPSTPTFYEACMRCRFTGGGHGYGRGGRRGHAGGATPPETPTCYQISKSKIYSMIMQAQAVMLGAGRADAPASQCYPSYVARVFIQYVPASARLVCPPRILSALAKVHAGPMTQQMNDLPVWGVRLADMPWMCRLWHYGQPPIRYSTGSPFSRRGIPSLATLQGKAA